MNSPQPTLKFYCFFISLLFFQIGIAQSALDTEDTDTLPSDDLNVSAESYTDNRPKIRLQFTSLGIINRQILLTVDDNCTDGYDWGYDGYLNDVQLDDMSWLIEDELFVIQGIGQIDMEETSLPLSIQKSNIGDVVISIQSLENIPDNLNIILHDTELDTHYDLRTTNYEASLSAGTYDDRFVIGFQNPSTLSIDDNIDTQLDFYYEMNTNQLVVRNPKNLNVTGIEVYNISGQKVYIIDDVLNENHSKYDITSLTSGIYIIRMRTDDNVIVSKKIVIQ
ncbi:T9SS type A sorting domain-containing protein [Winogradskyella marincola]|uniref:T9SS type A sorting domain-containing protein n=1 Tax=Winogradskyella marincola TaxID=3037795 RepID=A0ABT6G3M2_9FLAO|nr:T9SS type A sorting domain-containing protein [Winogradskyella sp. YYF002]MDG4716646.1 T9SS type A sorting domain-containing protein [Winogradskyella sp. YYF002]